MEVASQDHVILGKSPVWVDGGRQVEEVPTRSGENRKRRWVFKGLVGRIDLCCPDMIWSSTVNVAGLNAGQCAILWRQHGCTECWTKEPYCQDNVAVLNAGLRSPIVRTTCLSCIICWFCYPSCPDSDATHDLFKIVHSVQRIFLLLWPLIYSFNRSEWMTNCNQFLCLILARRCLTWTSLKWSSIDWDLCSMQWEQCCRSS